MTGNPIQLLKELSFSSATIKKYGFPPAPEGLSVSPNGRHIVIYNEEDIYHFDLEQPDGGWQNDLNISSDVSKVFATDNGGIWAILKQQNTLVKLDGTVRQDFSGPSVKAIWGNDDWLLTHDGDELGFVSIDGFLIRKVNFKRTILHAWRHGTLVRLLVTSECSKRIYLYEWGCNEEKPVLKNTIRYAGNIGIRGISVDYMFTSHVHAWPNQDGSLTIRLLPCAVSVSVDGTMCTSEDHIVWSPIVRGNSPLSRSMLAKVSAHALDDGFDPTSGFSSTPYLITTLQTEGDIHLVSTLWHKKLPLELIDSLDPDELEKNLENKGITEFLLTACEEDIPPLKIFAENILSQLAEIRNPAQIPAFLARRHEQIGKVFRQIFPSVLKTFVREECSSQLNSFSEMYEILEKLGRMPGLSSAFFDALNDDQLTFNERHILVAKCLRRIIHVLPKSVRSLGPAHLVKNALSLRKSILYAEPAAASFLIEKAPSHFFTVDNLIMLFEHFHNNVEVLESLIGRMARMKKRLSTLSAVKKVHLDRTIAQSINTDSDNGHRVMLKMLEHGKRQSKGLNCLNFFIEPFYVETMWQ